MNIDEQMYFEMIDNLENEISNLGIINDYNEYDEIIPTTVKELNTFENILFKQNYYTGNINKFNPLLQTIENMVDKNEEFFNSNEYVDLIDYYKNEFLEMLESILQENNLVKN